MRFLACFYPSFFPFSLCNSALSISPSFFYNPTHPLSCPPSAKAQESLRRIARNKSLNDGDLAKRAAEDERSEQAQLAKACQTCRTRTHAKHTHTPNTHTRRTHKQSIAHDHLPLCLHPFTLRLSKAVADASAAVASAEQAQAAAAHQV